MKTSLGSLLVNIEFDGSMKHWKVFSSIPLDGNGTNYPLFSWPIYRCSCTQPKNRALSFELEVFIFFSELATDIGSLTILEKQASKSQKTEIILAGQLNQVIYELNKQI